MASTENETKLETNSVNPKSTESHPQFIEK